MKKEIFMIAAILVLVATGHIVTQNYNKKIFNEIGEDLKNLRSAILDENENQSEDKDNAKYKNKDAIVQSIQSIHEKWEDKYDVLAYYIEHDELEKVGTQLTLVRASCEVEEYDDSVMQVDQCLFLLEHIKDKESFKLVNIF